MISRCVVRTGRHFAVALLAGAALGAIPAIADSSLSVSYRGQTVCLTHVMPYAGVTAVGIQDPAFGALLRATGAVLSWKSRERYILITTSTPTIVSFALGSRRYEVGPTVMQAEFAPIERGDEPYLPLDDVVRALGLTARRDGAALALESSITSAPQPVAGSPTPEPAPTIVPNRATVVTGVGVTMSDEGLTVNVSVSGDAAYEWHRLRDPDNRFWVDIKDATLQGSPIEQNEPAPLVSMRVRQVDTNTVRIALTLQGPKAIAVEPSTSGLGIVISAQDIAGAPRSGSGSLGSIVSEKQSPTAAVTPAPIEESSGGSGAEENGWKFGPRETYVPTNPRLIVLDPGHGGSDRGTIHGGVAEAELTLDMAKRLRDILTALGWQVKLTRTTDTDVYAPNDSPHDELQARVDVANHAGARCFVSIHANAFINAGPYGTTLYISKAQDYALAHSIEARLADDGTKDDGIIKAHYYVTFHTKMPAVLIETAFLSNPSDYALLTSPAWRQKVAQEIAQGIEQYARENPVRQ
ncbi:MAG: N-acetylmuramoyl-L-alanine amidase [Candidatus Eremiobacteraeota bacterium]|nr:N-acetylmuramoyl-L-alanine amidase [Candidatus Eremiobacteraeota bacterium]